MRPWKRVRDALRSWRSRNDATATTALPDRHLLEANRNLRELLEDTGIPASVRQALEPEFQAVERLSEKLQREEVHVAVFGRVGTGKSSLCNALLGEQAFATSPLHGETRDAAARSWEELGAGNAWLIDTPGIDELSGEERERLAREAAARADVLVMVCEGDLTDTERRALESLARRRRPLLLVLNKADRYTAGELDLLLGRLRERCRGLLPPDRVLAAAADPRAQTVIEVDEDGAERERLRERKPDVADLRQALWTMLESEGKTLAALNAALFASELDAQIARRVVEARRETAEALIRRYCIAKGIAVAANPVPVADLLAAAGVDVAMVVHLGQVYGHRPSRREASRLLLTISAQLAALMGAYWGVNLASSALKGVSAGMSTVLTGTAQGVLAWYATYLTGRAAESWFAAGKHWGPGGPRETVRDILDSVDRDSILRSARDEILQLMSGGRK